MSVSPVAVGSESVAQSSAVVRSESVAPSSVPVGSESVALPSFGSSLRNPNSSVSIPMRIVSECRDRTVCAAMVDGSIYKGTLLTYDELSMSATLQDVEVTEAGGEKSKRDAVFIRGNMIRFFMLPSAFESHPILDLFQKPTRDSEPRRDSGHRDSDRRHSDRRSLDRRESDRRSSSGGRDRR